jgi:hypothetical protein
MKIYLKINIFKLYLHYQNINDIYKITIEIVAKAGRFPINGVFSFEAPDLSTVVYFFKRESGQITLFSNLKSI